MRCTVSRCVSRAGVPLAGGIVHVVWEVDDSESVLMIYLDLLNIPLFIFSFLLFLLFFISGGLLWLLY